MQEYRLPPVIDHNLPSDTAKSLANLAEATQADRQAVANLTNANNTLTTQLQNVISQLSISTKEISNLKAQFSSGKTPATPPPNTPAESTYKHFSNNNYCWSHGHDIGNDHTSASCHFKKPGHIDTATKADTQGGKEYNKYRLPHNA